MALSVGLPDVLVNQVFEMSNGATVARASSFSKQFNKCAKPNALWEKLFRQDYHYTPEKRDLDFKKVYRTRFLTLKNLTAGSHKVTTIPLERSQERHFPADEVFYMRNHNQLAMRFRFGQKNIERFNFQYDERRILIPFNNHLKIHDVKTGAVVRNFEEVPGNVFIPRLPEAVSLFNLFLQKTLDRRVILETSQIGAIFNPETLSFEYACRGEIVEYEYPFAISYLSSGEFNVIDIATRKVHFSFAFPNCKIRASSFKDDIFIFQTQTGEVRGYNVRQKKELFRFQEATSFHAIKIMSQTRFVVQTNTPGVLLMNTQTGEIVKRYDSLRLFPHRDTMLGGRDILRFVVEAHSIQCMEDTFILYEGSDNGEIYKKIHVMESSEGIETCAYQFDEPIFKVLIVHKRLVVQTKQHLRVFDLEKNKHLFTHTISDVSIQHGEEVDDLVNILHLRKTTGKPCQDLFLDLSSGTLFTRRPRVEESLNTYNFIRGQFSNGVFAHLFYSDPRDLSCEIYPSIDGVECKMNFHDFREQAQTSSFSNSSQTS